MDAEMLRPLTAVGGAAAVTWWALVGVALPLGLILALLVARWRLLAAASHERHDSEASARPLSRGPAVLLGVVDGEPGGDAIPPVRVAVEQRGREYIRKGKTQHVWSEDSRDVRHKPFYVRRSNGERVRVIPDGRVFLVDRLDGIERVSPGLRRRTATLIAGEQVYIVGRLLRGLDPEAQGGNYREAPEGWMLVPPSGGGRMLISTEPPGARFAKRARVFRGLVLLALLVTLGMHALCFSAWDDLLVRGRRVTLGVDDAKTWRSWYRTRYGGHWRYFYELSAHDAAGSYVARTSPKGYSAIAAARDHAQAVAVTWWVTPWHAVVGGRQLERNGGFGASALLVGLVAVILAIRTGTQPWYERRRIVDRGRGPLATDTVSIR